MSQGQSSSLSSATQVPLKSGLLPGWERLNPRLNSAIQEMAGALPDAVSHNASGQSYFANKWLSPSKLHQEGPPVFREFAALVEEVIAGVVGEPLKVSSLWSIVSREGMEGGAHNHAGRVSLAYYVDPGESGPAKGGLMQFYADPESREPSHTVIPKAGLLIMFPSGLFHSVSRYTGSKPRIVISANLK